MEPLCVCMYLILPTVYCYQGKHIFGEFLFHILKNFKTDSNGSLRTILFMSERKQQDQQAVGLGRCLEEGDGEEEETIPFAMDIVSSHKAEGGLGAAEKQQKAQSISKTYPALNSIQKKRIGRGRLRCSKSLNKQADFSVERWKLCNPLNTGGASRKDKCIASLKD